MAIRLEYEGILDANFKATTLVTAGKIAMLDTSAVGVVKVSDGTAAYGIFAEDNKVFADGDYYSPVKPVQAVGDKVGVYKMHGVYKTDQFVTATFANGDDLYVTTEGKFTKTQGTASETAGTVKVGKYIRTEDDMIVVDLAL